MTHDTTLEAAQARYRQAKSAADAEEQRQHMIAEARAEEQRLARLRTRGQALGVTPFVTPRGAPAQVRPLAPPAAARLGRPSVAIVARARQQLGEQGRAAMARVEAARQLWEAACAAHGVRSKAAEKPWQAFKAAKAETADLIASARAAGLL